jgi:hypothetical protein
MHLAKGLAAVTLLAAAATNADQAPVAAGPAPEDAWWKLDSAALRDAFGIDGWQDVFRFGRWQAAVDLDGYGNYQATDSPDQPDTKNWSRLTGQGVTVRNLGFSILDPRLLIGNATARFGFRQLGQMTDQDDVQRVGDSEVTDYYFDATLLAAKPYNATFMANRSEYVGTQSGGGVTASVTTAQAATFNLREDSLLRDRDLLNFFSASLDARDEHLTQRTRTAGNEFRRDEERRTLALEAHNGFEYGDLNFTLEDLELTNHLAPANDFHAVQANLNHSQDFGGLRNHRSDTRVSYSDRDGAFSVTTLDADQTFSLQHTDILSSSYGYAYSSNENAFARATSQFLTAGVGYLPFLNLSTGLQFFANQQSYHPGTIEGYGTYADVTYSHGIPGSGNLSVNLGGGYSVNDSQLPSGLVPVIDEAYQAPPEFGAGAGVELRNPDVVAESIVVVVVRDGSRLPTAEGIDYVIDVVGAVTRVVPLASSAVMLPGDPLQISYVYQVDPDLKSSVTSGSLQLVADWRWIAVTYSHDQTIQTPLSGDTESTLLGDQKRDTLRVDLRGDWGAWSARANSGLRRTRDTRVQYDEVRTGADFSWQPTWVWALNLNVSHGDTRFLDTGRTTRTSDVRLGGSWTTGSGWWGNGHVGYRTLDDSELLPETLVEARVQIRRSWPSLDLSVSCGVGERTRGEITTDSADVSARVSRQFR